MMIAVLCGGISQERNVSLAGGKAVNDALYELGHQPIMFDPALGKNAILNASAIPIIDTPPTAEELSQFDVKNMIECFNIPLWDKIDMAFLVLHGKYGEDGVIQALLEARGIPYTGSGVKASAIGMDKNTCKLLFMSSGLTIPQWYPIRPQYFNDYDYLKAIRGELGKRIVVKPNDQGSSVGVTIIENGSMEEFQEAVLHASKYSNLVLAEKFIEGREITVGVIDGQVLPVVEIIAEEGFYDYEHKYQKGHTRYECPADIPEDIQEFAQNMALTAYYSVGCEGFARVDFRLNEEGVPYVIEINTIPGFTATSLVPMAAKEVGYSFAQLCQLIIETTMRKYNA